MLLTQAPKLGTYSYVALVSSCRTSPTFPTRAEALRFCGNGSPGDCATPGSYNTIVFIVGKSLMAWKLPNILKATAALCAEVICYNIFSKLQSTKYRKM